MAHYQLLSSHPEVDGLVGLWGGQMHYGFPLSNTWVIVGCFLLHVATAWSWPVLALSLFIGEPYAAPDAVSTGVCGGCSCYTTLQFFCFLKRFRHKARNEPYFCQQHSLRNAAKFHSLLAWPLIAPGKRGSWTHLI